MIAWFYKMRLRYQVWRWMRSMNQVSKWMGKVQKTLGAMGAPVLKEQPKPVESSIFVVGDGFNDDSPRYRRAKDVN